MNAAMLNLMGSYICYKYRGLGSKDLKVRAEHIIVKNRLFYAAPTRFNDPYDCVPPVVLPESDAELEKLITPTLESIKKKRGIGEGIDVAQLIPLIREDSYRISEATMENEIAVLCMSLTETNPQQWAYYADSYAGICIGIDMSYLPDQERAEVKYEEERVTVDYAAIVSGDPEVKKDFLRAIATKHTGWQHEQEVRFFKTREDRDGYEFPPEALQEIIFGHRCDDMTIDYVARICERSDASPSFGYVLPNEKTFSLDACKGLTITQVKSGLEATRARKNDIVSAIPSYAGR